jgi:hypothetical protein
MKAFLVRLDARSGSLARLSEAMAGKGVNVVAVSAMPGDRQTVGFVADPEDAARQALRQAGIRAREFDVIQLALANEPGALARVAAALEGAGTPIQLLLTLRASRGRALDVIAVADPARAEMVLRGLPEDSVLR